MWLGGLHGCNEWAERTGRLGRGGGLIWTRRTGRNIGLRGLGRTAQTGADSADWADRADGTDWAEGGVRGGLGGLGQTWRRTGRIGRDADVQIDRPLYVLGPKGFKIC